VVRGPYPLGQHGKHGGEQRGAGGDQGDFYAPEVTSSLVMALTCGCAAKVGIVAG
jgi:hypothetical protein